MPQYYFETSDGTTVVQGNRSISLDGIEAARTEAHKVIRDLARDIIPDDRDRSTLTVKVRDEIGKVVVTAALSQRRGRALSRFHTESYAHWPPALFACARAVLAPPCLWVYACRLARVSRTRGDP